VDESAASSIFLDILFPYISQQYSKLTLLIMHLRPLQLSDLADIAELTAETQFDDEVVAFIAPYRQKYYTSYRNGFVRRIHARSLRPGWIYWVAETDEGDEPTAMQKQRGGKEFGGRVVGYAAWLREGESPVARNWQRMNEGWFTSQCSNSHSYAQTGLPSAGDDPITCRPYC
jgi:hypothetical protein